MRSALHLCKFILGLEQPATQVTDKELSLLLNYSYDANTVVEIGCYEGNTSVALANNTKGKVYSVDPFFSGRLGICYSELVARIHCKRKKTRNLQFLKGYSFDVARNFHQPIDFLFIDADHSYEGVSRDWQDWLPKMKSGGILALHDCKQASNSSEYIGSMQFYDNDIPTIQEVEEVDAVDSLVVLRKK